MFDGRNILLRPVAAIYGGVTGFRNFLYDCRILPSTEFSTPVICIGNLSMGGTGKTPHTEYVAQLLSDEFNVAVLSRGYGRKSTGFRYVEAQSHVADTGDEPLQIKTKHPHLTVAVCADRVTGVKTILSQKPETGVIILDDGFQHRRIKPGLSVILTSYGSPFTEDHLLPFGSLRENRIRAGKADIVVVTKTPGDAQNAIKDKIADNIRNLGVRHIFFTSFRYLEPVNVFDSGSAIEPGALSGMEAVLVTGIANPDPLGSYLRKSVILKAQIRFPDHHDFSARDLEKIYDAFNTLKTVDKLILTTEKDAVRFREIPDLSGEIEKAMFYIPVAVDFPDGDKAQFDKLIKAYARKNK